MLTKWLKRWTRNVLTPAARQGPVKARNAYRPRFEGLEERTLMTTGPGVVFNDGAYLHWQLFGAVGHNYIDKVWGGANWSPNVGDWIPSYEGHADGIGAVEPLGNNTFRWYTLSSVPGGSSGIQLSYDFYVPGWNQHFLAGNFLGHSNGESDFAISYEDGHSDIQWEFLDRTTGNWYSSHYGGLGAYPVAGDWDGYGYAGIGVVSGNTLLWQLKDWAGPGSPDHQFYWGWGGTVPITGDWDGNGTVTPGIFVHGAVAPYNTNNAVATWLEHNYNSGGGIENGFGYGAAWGYTPVPGNWDGSGGASNAEGSHRDPTLGLSTTHRVQLLGTSETIITDVALAPTVGAAATAPVVATSQLPAGAVANTPAAALDSGLSLTQNQATSAATDSVTGSHQTATDTGAVDALFSSTDDPLRVDVAA